MSRAWPQHQRDRLLAVGAAVFAGTLFAAARGIEDSMLSDAVGAGGVPQGVGVVMALAALALFAKTFVGRAATAEAGQAEAGRPSPWRTAGLAAVLLAYGALLPWFGYALMVSLLVGACGWLAGARFKTPLLLFAALSGPGLWALFDRLLQVRMPVGTLWG